MLPAIVTPAEWTRLAGETERFLPGARAICARHGLHAELERSRDGSMLVFLVGDAVLKLFAAPFRRWADSEVAFLTRVHGRLGVPTPELLATGEQDGWSYVLMRRLHGTPLDRRAERGALCAQLGEVVAALHAVPVDGLPVTDFLARGPGCVEAQAKKGLAEPWLAQIPAFLARHAPATQQLAVAHTELGPGHVLVSDDRITGIIDFADAVVCERDFELPAVGIFLTRGEPGLYRRFLAAYGRAVDAERVLACALLHPYSNLAWYLREVPPPAGSDTLEALATFYFGS